MDELMLLSGADIPCIPLGIPVHPPTLKEISYITEEIFFSGCEILKFSKHNLMMSDKIDLDKITDFDIIMSIITDLSEEGKKAKNMVEKVLTLFFPNYEIEINKKKKKILLTDGTVVKEINSNNYNSFKDIVKEICGLKNKEVEDELPQGQRAREIAEKIRRGKQKVAQLKSENEPHQKVAILSRYASILAVGESKDLNSIMNYTVYQLFDEFKRFELKEAYDIYVKAKMAGAKDLKEVDNWMKDIHE